MAYTPINWQTGDTITAEKMNKMDNGWGVEQTQLFSETVTTTALQSGARGTMVYDSTINAPTITVAFDGTDYTCQRIDYMSRYYYGGFTQSGPDYSEYPFIIQSADGENFLYTATAGTYTVAVSTEGVEVSGAFSSAVGKSIVAPIFTEDGIGTGDFTCNITFSELKTATTNGTCFMAWFEGVIYNLTEYDESMVQFSRFMVDATAVTQAHIQYFVDGTIEWDSISYPSE